MRVLALVVVVATGCSHPARPAPKPWTPSETGDATPYRKVVQPPPFPVGFLLDGLPPPLTHVPGVTPAFPLVPGWPEICEHRGRLAADVLEYALAWCGARSGDRRVLIGQLRASQASKVPGLAVAAVEDLANLMADTREPASTVVSTVDPRDVEVLDYLAAIYVEQDQGDDALRALAARTWPPASALSRESQCRRAVLRTVAHLDLEAAARLLGFADTRCLQHLRVLRCTVARAVISTAALAIRDRDATAPCPDGSQLDDAELRAEQLAETYLRWDNDRSATWFAVVDAAIAAIDEIGDAEALAIDTLERIVRGGCISAEVERRVHELRGHDPRLEPRLDRLVISRCFGH